MTTPLCTLPTTPRCLTHWSPPGSVAHPPSGARGVVHHGNQQKAAVLMWSERHLHTHIFRGGCAPAMLSNLPPAKTHSVRLPDDSATGDAWSDAEISTVLAGRYETVVLTSDGQLYTCETQPSRLQPLPTTAVNRLGFVRAACVTAAGGFVLVCSSGQCGLFVHVLPANFGERLRDGGRDDGIDGRRFDISFEPNELQSTWNSARIVVAELVAPALALATGDRCERFFGLLRGEQTGTIDPTGEHSCIVLSINSQLLLLLAPDADSGSATPEPCQLRVLHTAATDIRALWLTAGGDALCVLLDSGAMDVLHASAALGDAVGLQRSVLTFGDRVGCVGMRDDVFVFAADERLVQVRLKWMEHRDRFEAAERHETGLCGVTALAFVPEAHGLLMLTENGFLYAMRWPADFAEEGDNGFDEAALYRVDDAFERRAQLELADIVRLSAEHRAICEQIEASKREQQVLLLAKEPNRSAPFRAHLTATKTLPTTLSSHTIYLGRSDQRLIIDRNSFFVAISLRVSGDNFADWNLQSASTAAMWTLCVRETHPHRTEAAVRSVRLHSGMFSNALKSPVQMLLSTACCSQDGAIVLPEFHIELQAVLRNGADFQLAAFPVPIDRPLSIDQLISVHDHEPFSYADVLFGRADPERKATLLEYRLALPPAVGWPDVLAALGKGGDGAQTTAAASASVYYVCLLERCVRMSWEKQTLCLSSTDAGVLYEVKVRVVLGLRERFGGGGATAEELDDACLNLLLMTEDAATDDTNASAENLLKSLRQVRQAGASMAPTETTI